MAIEDEMKDVQQLVVNQLGVANGLNNSLADGQVTPDKMSAGAPTWGTDGRLLINGGQVEINPYLVGDDDAFIDFHSTSASEPSFDARIHKKPGENSNFQLHNTGTGSTVIYQGGAAKFVTNGGEDGYTTIAGGGTAAADGAKISLYGSGYPTSSDSDILYSAGSHQFRNSTGATYPSYVQMNMTNEGNAELVVASSDNSGEANLKVSSFTPSIILEDKTTSSKDFQLMANSNHLKILSGDTSGDAQLTNELLAIDNTGKIRVGGENPEGEGPICYIHGTRDADTTMDRLELSGDEVALMSGSNYATEALRVALGNVYVPNGALLIGRESASSTANESGTVIHRDGNIFSARDGNSQQPHIVFMNNADTNVSIVGSIQSNGSSTTFYTNSDYRLKEDIVDMEGSIERLKDLKPVNFKWKSDGTRVDGFIAHEAQEVVPEAVGGTKDALDEEGNPEYQGIDQSKLVPLLTKALQEAVAKIEALEVRITALEA